MRTTVSTTNIPISPPENPGRYLNHRNGGSFLDADHPASRVLFARRSTILNRAGIADKLLHIEFRITSKEKADEWKDAVAGLNYTPLSEDRKPKHAAWAKGHVRLIVERADNEQKAKLRTNIRRSSAGWRFAIYMLAALEPWAVNVDEIWQLFGSDRGAGRLSN